VPVERVALNGRQKAAVVLLALGQEVSAKVLRHLSEEEIRDLAQEMMGLSRLTAEQQRAVLQEFLELAVAQKHMAGGGTEYVRGLLSAALGDRRAAQIVSQLSSMAHSVPFEFLRKADPGQLLNFVRSEHPQAVALVLAYVKPEQAAYVLSQLPQEVRTEIAYRLSTLGHITPEVVKEVEGVLQGKMSGGEGEGYESLGGAQMLAEILQRVDRTTEEAIIEHLEQVDASLAQEVRNRMFVFEDIVELEDRALQQVLMEVPATDLALALKKTRDQVREKIFRNMSQRAGEHLREEMELLGPQRVSVVEEAQQRVVASIRRLEEEGRLTIARAGEEEIVE